MHTGDLAERDHQNRFYFKGRRKDVIVTGEGHNIYPGDVEAVLDQQEGVQDSVVIGVNSGELQEVHAVLLLEGGAQASEVVNEANKSLNPHQRIRSWTIWPHADFPRSNLLKVRRERVIEKTTKIRQTNTQARKPTHPIPTLAEIQAEDNRLERLQLLAEYLTDTPSEDSIAESLLLVEDLGLGSLDLIELMVLLEKRLNRTLERVPVSSELTVESLQDLVAGDRAEEHSNGLPVHQPRWSAALPGRVIRRITQPLLIGLWSRSTTNMEVHWELNTQELEGPWIIAAAPHHHWLDGFVVYSALPGPWRKRLLTVTNRDFSEYFNPSVETSKQQRREVGWAYHVLWPLVFEFVIIPNYGSTREGLYQLGRYIERGYSPITFPKGLTPPGEPNPRHEPGMALMALQSGLPLLPVWLQGNAQLQRKTGRKPRKLSVYIGRPINTHPSQSVPEVVARVDDALKTLAEMAGQAG